MLKATVTCVDCDTQFQSERKWKKRCPACFVIARRARNRIYLKRKYELEHAGKPRFGDHIQCAGCGTGIIRTAPLKKYCAACALTEITRASSAKRRRALGKEQIGEPFRCDECGVSVLRKVGRHKFCDACRIKQVSTKRSLARRRKTDPAFVIGEAIRSSIYSVLKGTKNRRSWESLVGYTAENLKRHIERQFKGRMSWKNYGARWHIDHIVPLASFSGIDGPDHPDVRLAWALSNLRPLWAKDNMKKHARRTHLV